MLPAQVQAIWDSAPVRRSPADWALQWLWNQPEVAVALSGMTTLEQVKQNGTLPRVAAMQLAVSRVRRAMACRRWSIY